MTETWTPITQHSRTKKQGATAQQTDLYVKADHTTRTPIKRGATAKQTDLSDQAHLRLADVVAGVHGGVGRGDDGHEVRLVPRVRHRVPHGVRRKPFRQMLLLFEFDIPVWV